MKLKPFIIFTSLIFWSLSTTAQNEPKAITNTLAGGCRNLTPQELKFFHSQGIDTLNVSYNTNLNTFEKIRPPTFEEAAWYKGQNIDPAGVMLTEEMTTNYLPRLSATPDIALIYIDIFMGMTNVTLPVKTIDITNTKVGELKFFFQGQAYKYSGNYAVFLNTARKHKSGLFAFGSSIKASWVILDEVAGQPVPLKNPIVWENSAGFIDVEAFGKEWIYSGPYSIEN